MAIAESSATAFVGTSKFGLKDKLGYLSGNFGNELMWDLVSGYLMVYFTDLLGISPALTGILLVGARFWDAFMDVVAGRYADSKPAGKHGKFKPIVMQFCIPMFICSILIFTKIPGIPAYAETTVVFAAYVIYGTLHSFVTIPYGASISAISTEASDRATLSTFRTLGGTIGRVLMSVIIPLYAFSDNKASELGFLMVAIGFAVSGVIAYILYFYLVTERSIAVPKKGTKGSLFVSLKALVKNRSFISFLVVSIVLLAAYTAQTILQTYLFKDYLGNAGAMAGTGIIMVLNIVLIAPLCGPLTKRFGKKETASVAILSTAVIFALIAFVPIKNAYLFIVLLWIANAGYNYFSFIMWAFLADIGDEQELLAGRREDGTVFSLFNYGRKLGQSIATAFVGLALTAAGYVASTQQTPEVAFNIKLAATLGPAALYFLAFLGMQFWFPMTKEKLKDMAVALNAARRAQS